MTLKERQERLKAIAARCAELAKFTDGKDARDLTEDEMKELTDLGVEAEGHEAQIRAAQAAAKAAALAGTSGGRQTNPGKPETDPAAKVTGGGLALEEDPMLGFASAGDWARSVKEASRQGGDVDDRLLAAHKIMSSSGSEVHTGRSGEDMGYLPPPALRQRIWENVFDDSAPDLFNLVDVEPTEKSQVEILADESTPWAASGIVAQWRVGREALSKQRAEAPDPRTMKLQTLSVFLAADEELLSDAPRLENRLTVKSGQAIRWELSDVIMNGDGVAKPLGFLNSDALVTVAKDDSQTADTITASNVVNMYSRMLAQDIPYAIWRINQDAMPQIMLMQHAGQPIWTPPASGFAGAPGGFLLGRPIMPCEHSQTLGDLGDINFVSMRGYHMAMRSPGIKYAVSMHLLFDYDEMAFKWVMRVNGQPFLSAPVSPNNGTNTRSHFVTLAERA